MLAERLEALDRVLRERHASLYGELQEGVRGRSVKFDGLREWFGWKNGQGGGERPYERALLFGWHRFVPLEEGRDQLREARWAVLKDPLYALFVLTIGRSLLRSWPLVVDASGAGYYFDTGRRSVLYRQKGEHDMWFASFEEFVSFLTELAAAPADERKFLQVEARVRGRYVCESE